MTEQEAIKSLQEKFGVKIEILADKDRWHLGNFIIDRKTAIELAEKFTVK